MNKIYNGISHVAWGYFFIYFNINLNTVSIIPTFVGYILMLSAISDLQEEVEELKLLRPLAILLLIWHGAQWIASWGGVDLENFSQFLSIIVCLVDLYFHFQLITNIAAIAAKYQQPGMDIDEKLLWYRNLLVILETLIMIVSYFAVWLAEFWTIIAVVMLLVNVIVTICLMKTLFSLRREVA